LGSSSKLYLLGDLSGNIWEPFACTASFQVLQLVESAITKPHHPCHGAMTGGLPDFLGIGVQKGGTTTLQRLLEQHPGACLPAAKELHYFSLHYGQGEDWYRQHFAGAASSQRRGEITPYYLFHPAAPQRIRALLPQVKLVVLLRDPVERALSQYFHSVRLGLEPLALEPALAAEEERLAGAEPALQAADGRHSSHQEHSYLARSRYERQLPAWEALFPSEQLLVLRSEDFFRSPAQLWPQLLCFLGLERCALPPLERPANAGRGEAAAVPVATRRKLRAQLECTYQWAAQRYGIGWDDQHN
jgi:hypothetical protein